MVRHAFGGLGEALDVADQTLSDIKLAVTEACTNVVVHAYPDGEGPMEVARRRRRRAACTVVVARRGPRHRAAARLARASASGLPLIATLAETLELGTGDDERTEVRMTFRLDGRTAEAA